MKTRKRIPKFKDEAAEREFWSREDSTQYVDWSRAQTVTLVNLKPTFRTISLRLPESMIAELKLLANKRDVPYCPDAPDAITRGKQPNFFVVDGYDIMMLLEDDPELPVFLRRRHRLLAEEGRVCVSYVEL